VLVLLDNEFAELLRLSTVGLRRYCARFSGDPDELDDMVQNTLFAAWAAREQLRSDAAFTHWVFAIARNTCMREVRHRRCTVSLSRVNEELITSPTPADAMAAIRLDFADDERLDAVLALP
jgi:DNA-directed RNA polymerase specialized sigma24 family protein